MYGVESKSAKSIPFSFDWIDPNTTKRERAVIQLPANIFEHWIALLIFKEQLLTFFYQKSRDIYYPENILVYSGETLLSSHKAFQQVGPKASNILVVIEKTKTATETLTKSKVSTSAETGCSSSFPPLASSSIGTATSHVDDDEDWVVVKNLA